LRGDSSLHEEEQLRQYYTAVEPPQDLAPYADLFRYFSAEATLVTSPAWEKQLEQAPRARLWPLWSRWATAAAAIILLLTASWLWWQQPQPQLAATEETIDWSKYEVEDPTEALRIAHRALQRTSVALQQSTRRATDEVRQVHKILPNLK
jgi:hypothetical protein